MRRKGEFILDCKPPIYNSSLGDVEMIKIIFKTSCKSDKIYDFRNDKYNDISDDLYYMNNKDILNSIISDRISNITEFSVYEMKTEIIFGNFGTPIGVDITWEQKYIPHTIKNNKNKKLMDILSTLYNDSEISFRIICPELVI
jgi:hypothetical protein